MTTNANKDGEQPCPEAVEACEKIRTTYAGFYLAERTRIVDRACRRFAARENEALLYSANLMRAILGSQGYYKPTLDQLDVVLDKANAASAPAKGQTP